MLKINTLKFIMECFKYCEKGMGRSWTKDMSNHAIRVQHEIKKHYRNLYLSQKNMREKVNFTKLSKLVGELPPPFPKSKRALETFFRNNKKEIAVFESEEINEMFVDTISLQQFIDNN